MEQCSVPGCTRRKMSAGGDLPPKAWCSMHSKARQGIKPWQAHKKDYCEKCGPEIKYHHCQLDVDHRDGNKANNDPSNYQTLCANCHRLKTFEEKDWAKAG